MTITDKDDGEGQVKVTVEFDGDGFDQNSPAHREMLSVASRIVGDAKPEVE